MWHETGLVSNRKYDLKSNEQKNINFSSRKMCDPANSTSTTRKGRGAYQWNNEVVFFGGVFQNDTPIIKKPSSAPILERVACLKNANLREFLIN